MLKQVDDSVGQKANLPEQESIWGVEVDVAAISDLVDATDIMRRVRDMGHDVNTPLTAIVTHMDLLGNYGDRLTPEKRNEKTGKIFTSFGQLSEKIGSLQCMASGADSGNTDAHSIDTGVEAQCEEVLSTIGQLLTSDDRDGALPEFMQSAVAQIKDMIEDIHSAAQELDQREVHPHPSRVAALMRDQIGAINTISTNENQVLLDGPIEEGGDPLVVYTDQAKLSRITQNLINNALKHGGTDVRVSLKADCEGEGAYISVSDSGPGISKDKIAEIFQYGVKGEESSGTGSGLTIAARHIHMLGGRLWVKSAMGQGTTMTIFVPNFVTNPNQ